jgi:NCS1 family nucleobase:cation symporter-1
VTAIVLGALTFMTATIATNIVANFVSAAMDLTNLAPKYLTFRRAGVLASLISVMVMPWKLYANAVMVQYTLGTLGAFIGPIFGIIICDYFIIRKQSIDLDSLYTEDPRGKYWYRNGFNPNAILALVLAGIFALSISQLALFASVAAYSWFFGAFAGGILHYAFSGRKERTA